QRPVRLALLARERAASAVRAAAGGRAGQQAPRRDRVGPPAARRRRHPRDARLARPLPRTGSAGGSPNSVTPTGEALEVEAFQEGLEAGIAGVAHDSNGIAPARSGGQGSRSGLRDARAKIQGSAFGGGMENRITSRRVLIAAVAV